MNLYTTREAIRTEMAKATPDQARLSQLIEQRDALVAAEKAETITGAEFEARMLQAVHG